jgi:rhodanese-related sulfurtransferase
MKEISRQELQNKLKVPNQPIVVEVLGSKQYREFHLPSAINVPLGDDFEQRLARAVPDKSAEVVVYCADEDCDASPKAARRLERYGYRNVLDYSAGKQDWQRAGLPVERG